MLRRSLELTAGEDRILRRLYVEFRIPSDQYKSRPDDATSFRRRWNAETRRHDSWEEILHYIVTKRKQKLWETLDERRERAPDPPDDLLPPGDLRHLEQAYRSVVLAREMASDHLMFDRDLAAEVARAFKRSSKRSFPTRTLVGYIIRKRKRGEWITQGE